MPPNHVYTLACVEQALGNAEKVVELILLGDLNVRLREPCDCVRDTPFGRHRRRSGIREELQWHGEIKRGGR